MNWMFQSFRFGSCLGAALIAVVAAMALAGCGSGGSSATADGSPTTITKAQLIKRGDAICRKTDQTQEAGLATYKKEHGGSGPSGLANEEKLMMEFGFPPVKAEVEELEALGAPQGDEAQVARFLHRLKEALESSERNPKLFLSAGGTSEFNQADKLAREYGFKDCADAL